MKKLLSLTLTMLMLLSFNACENNIDAEPPAPTDEGEVIEQSPFSDANTSSQYYISRTGRLNGFVYKDDFYYTKDSRIVAVPLGEAVKHDILTDGKLTYIEKYTALCPDPMCAHNTVDCPVMMGSSDAEFLIDAKESNDGPPVIYYYTANSIAFSDERSLVYDAYSIVRFDAAEGKAKQVAKSKDAVEQLMSYGDYLYFTTHTAEDKMELNVVKKTGGDVKTLVLGGCYLRLVGANGQGAYVNDEKGNVYSIDLAGDHFELIYTVPEVYQLSHTAPGELNMFVEGEYLYFYSDHEIGLTAMDWDVIKHSIRRVKLDAPSGEGEMVAPSVFEMSVYGVYNGVLYYGPFDARFDLEKPEYCASKYYSKGTIKGVDLETLETFDVVTDCGFNFKSDAITDYYINDRCIIGTIFEYRDAPGYDSMGGLDYCTLYSFEDGALYCVFGNPGM